MDSIFNDPHVLSVQVEGGLTGYDSLEIVGTEAWARLRGFIVQALRDDGLHRITYICGGELDFRIRRTPWTTAPGDRVWKIVKCRERTTWPKKAHYCRTDDVGQDQVLSLTVARPSG